MPKGVNSGRCGRPATCQQSDRLHVSTRRQCDVQESTCTGARPERCLGFEPKLLSEEPLVRFDFALTFHHGYRSESHMSMP